MSRWNAALGRLRVIDRTQKRAAAFAPLGDEYQFRVAPSCPPSKRLHMRGGRNANSANRGWAAWNYAQYRVYTVPDLTADLEDSDSVTPLPTFSTANWYQLSILCLRMPAETEEPDANDWSFYLHTDGTEFETAAEAEAWINADEFLLYNLWDTGAAIGSTYALCGIVLRNDGNIDSPGAILPIDVVNRGRSYVWPRDLRPRQSSDS